MRRGFVFVLAALVMLLTAPVAQAQDGDTNTGTVVPNHFWLQRPLPATANLVPEYGFPYGWTRYGQSPLHHGVDIVNRRGTPVLAAADGTVYYAGPDHERAFGPYTDFYGNVIVLQHAMDAPEGGTVFTLYGHLNTVEVESGASVTVGQKIGTVGATGIALGSHLHFEVRLGNPDDYNAVRNPMLWLAPLAGTGTLVGRMVDAAGAPAAGMRYVLSTETLVLPSFTYADGSVLPDAALNENFAMSDLRAGCYRVRVRGGAGYLYIGEVCITAGELTYLDMPLSQ